MGKNPKFGLMLIAYVFVVVAMVAGFARIEYVANTLDQRTVERAVEICEANNDTLGVIEAVLEGLTNPTSHEHPEELRRLAELREKLSELVQPIDCSIDPIED